MNIKTNKIYFLSDIHLGAPYIQDHKLHERRVLLFLDSIKEEAQEIFFVGDIFDFWFEYRYAIPRGFTRFFGKIAELSDRGIKIHFFGGNHDMWMFNYFQDELGVEIHRQSEIIERMGKRIYIAHGEDLGVKDKSFKLLLKIFRSTLFNWSIKTFVHPDLLMYVAKKWSGKSRQQNDHKQVSKYLGEDQEHLVQFAKQYPKDDIHYFIFGHRHIELNLMIKKDTHVVILGDWIKHSTYAMMDEKKFILTEFDSKFVK